MNQTKEERKIIDLIIKHSPITKTELYKRLPRDRFGYIMPAADFDQLLIDWEKLYRITTEDTGTDIIIRRTV
jgi:hypothetical protein